MPMIQKDKSIENPVWGHQICWRNRTHQTTQPKEGQFRVFFSRSFQKRDLTHFLVR